MQSGTVLYSDCYMIMLFGFVFFFLGGGDVPGRHTYPPFCPATLCRTVVEPGRLGVVQTRYTLRIHKQKSRFDHILYHIL